MVNQGIWGAIEQYWTVEEKPRLHRRNTVFEDYKISSYDSLKVGIVAISVTTIVIAVSLLGGIL